jgi:hypothetical protein
MKSIGVFFLFFPKSRIKMPHQANLPLKLFLPNSSNLLPLLEAIIVLKVDSSLDRPRRALSVNFLVTPKLSSPRVLYEF